MVKKYVQVNLPKEMAETIGEIIRNKEYGFVSRDDFVRDAVRENIAKYWGVDHKRGS